MGLLAEVPGEIAMPDLPVMQVPLRHTVVVIASIRAAGPVRRFSIQFFDDLGGQLVVVERARHGIVRLIPVGAVMNPLVFVVAAPERHAGMVAQAAYLVTRLGFYLLDKAARMLWIHGASEHKILPDQDAQLITKLVEDPMFIDATAPDPQHIHMRLLRCL